MTTINYMNRKIKLEECDKIEMIGSRYQIEYKTETKMGHQEVSFIELDRIDDMEEVAKVDIYVNQHNIDTTPKRPNVKDMSDKKKAFYAERTALRLQQELQKMQERENRLKALEDLVSVQAIEINKLKTGE